MDLLLWLDILDAGLDWTGAGEMPFGFRQIITFVFRECSFVFCIYFFCLERRMLRSFYIEILADLIVSSVDYPALPRGKGRTSTSF